MSFRRALQAWVLLGAALIAPASALAEPTVWAVKPGETLSRIAQRFEVEVEQIKRWNDLGDDTLLPGQELRIERSTASPIHRVAAGETLSAIAVRYGVSMDDLLDDNPGLDPDRIREGQELHIGGRRNHIEYRILPGDTLGAIARRHDVSVADLQRWNDGVDANRIRAGHVLKIYADGPASLSQSVGTPSHGRLLDPRALPRNRGYVIRDRARAWGTDEAIDNLIHAVENVRASDPGAPKLRVHDMSLKGGGEMADHRSHQSGRDVDVSYFQKRCEDGVCPFRRIAPSELDVKRQWTLLSYWLERNQVEAVFIDYHLQPALYREARRRGATREELARWFQYPDGRDSPWGVIRHFPKHADHVHVRFACHESDLECKSLRPLLAPAQHAKR